MNFLSWLLSLSLMIYLLMEGVVFHKATICRQEAWLEAFNLTVKTTLSTKTTPTQYIDPGCRLHVVQTNGKVFWQRFPSLKRQTLDLKLKGHL